MPTIHIVIKGKVQGVFYRATAKTVAQQLGIQGWVKNTKEGNVEVAASGSAEQLEAFVEWCKKGPSHANVIDVVINSMEDQTFYTFSITK